MRSILHIDMDAFYASVEQRDRPKYRNKPVIVGADPNKGAGRGVVSASSYEARKFGIHSAMPIGQAYRACPHAVFLPVRMDRYAEVSTQIFEIFAKFTNQVEPLSLDEAFLDVTGSHRLFGPADVIGKKIQQEIFKKVHLHASVGIATNKFVAKVASDLDKPQGFVVVPAGQERSFLESLPVEHLWGSGMKTTKRLHHMGCHVIGDVARQDLEMLHQRFGEMGIRLWYLANGIDLRPVAPHGSAKTLSAEITFSENTNDPQVLNKTLLVLADRLAQRLRAEGYRMGRLILKHRNEAFVTVTRSMSFPQPTNHTTALYEGAVTLYSQVSLQQSRVRLLGLAGSHLDSSQETQQMSLFECSSNQDLRISTAVDRIRRRFGDRAIQPARLVEAVSENGRFVGKREKSKLLAKIKGKSHLKKSRDP